MSMSKTLSYGTDILFIIFAVYLFFYYFDIFLKRRKRTVLSMIGLVIFMAWCKLRSNGMPVPLLRNGYSIFNGTKYR